MFAAVFFAMSGDNEKTRPSGDVFSVDFCSFICCSSRRT